MWQFLEHWRQGHADGPAKRVDEGPWGGAQQRPAPVLLDLDLTEVGEVVDDLLPFWQGVAACDEPVCRRSTTGNSVVTSAVLPGQRNEAIGRS